MGKVRFGPAIGASVRFIGEGWTRAWGVMLFLVWFTAMLQVFAVMKPAWRAVGVLGPIGLLFVGTAATGALYRLRFEGDHPGDPLYVAHPAGFQWGALEWRVLGANLLVGLILGVLFVTALFLWGVAIGVSVQGDVADLQAIEHGSQSEKIAALGRVMLQGGALATIFILLPALIGLLYLGARLSLFTPLAADTRAFDFGKTWKLGRGGMLALIAGALTIFVLEFLVGAVAGVVVTVLGGLFGHIGGVQAWSGALGQTINAAINPPLFAGLVLYVYRIQRGDQGVAATFS